MHSSVAANVRIRRRVNAGGRLQADEQDVLLLTQVRNCLLLDRYRTGHVLAVQLMLYGYCTYSYVLRWYWY